MTHAPGTPDAGPVSCAYGLGAAGNRVSAAEASGRTVDYGYDADYRLVTEEVTQDPAGNNGAVSYTYDPVGNRTQEVSTLGGVAGGNLSYDADDRITTDLYDNNGNTISSGGISFAYNFQNQMVQSGGLVATYDGDGNRVNETVGGVTTQYLIDSKNPTGLPQVLDELQNGVVVRTFDYGLQRISENQQVGGMWTPSFYGYDGHGSVRYLTNATGATTDTYDYDAFGNMISSTGSTPNEFYFAGEQFDSSLNLYYMRARYYRPQTGRFWTRDPIEGRLCCGMSWNAYLYALNNPVNAVDPAGREVIVEYLRLITPAAPNLPPSPLLALLLRPESKDPAAEKIIQEFLPTASPQECAKWERIDGLVGYTAGLGVAAAQSAGVEGLEIGGPAAEVSLHKIILPVYLLLFCPGG